MLAKLLHSKPKISSKERRAHHMFVDLPSFEREERLAEN